MIYTEIQTVNVLIRLLLEEHSDLALHCLPQSVCSKTLVYYVNIIDFINGLILFFQILYFIESLRVKVLRILKNDRSVL